LDKQRKFSEVLTFLELYGEHTTELTADFRSFFGISALDVGTKVRYSEALHLIAALLKDPKSRLFAAKSGLDHPVDHTWVLLAHLYDRFVEANTGKKHKPKKYPRPWKDPSVQKIGKKAIPLSRAKDFFARLGYKP
jgi:hypothetical protein